MSTPQLFSEQLQKIADYLESQCEMGQSCFDDPPQPLNEHSNNLLYVVYELRELANKIKKLP